MSDNSTYQQTIEEDTVLLLDESDMIEISPQTVTDEDPSEKYINEVEESEETLRKRLIEKKNCKEKPEETNTPIKKEEMQSLICEVPNQSKTSSTKRERIVWEKDDGDAKTKKFMIRTSNSDRSHSRSVQVIQEEKSSSRHVQTGHKSEKREKPVASSSTRTTEPSDLRKVVITTSQSKQKERKKEEKDETSTKTSRNGNNEHLHRHKHRPHSSTNDHPRHHEHHERHKKHGSSSLKNEEKEEKRKDENLRPKKRLKNSNENEHSIEHEQQQIKSPRIEQNEEISSIEKIKISNNIQNQVEEMEITEEFQQDEKIKKQQQISSEPSSHKKLKKYSKFESTSESSFDEDYNEMEEDGKKIIENESGVHSISTSAADKLDDDYEFAENDYLNEHDNSNDIILDDLENKNFELLTQDEKAVLSPEKLKQLEDAYQRRLISQLPVYYPGISGCRSVVEYECLNKISEGTYGVVYRAQEKKTDDIVALKRLKMEKEHQGFPITSLREINMLLKCGTHPNVLNVKEVVVTSNAEKIFLVMEYVEHDLKSLIDLMKKREKKWTIPQVKTLLHQLLSGIEYMHDQYVIHRDLKTSNLLLSHRGILKICDFGLAREFGDPLKPYTPVVVTLWYRSPELLLGCRIYSTPVDMWSIGCIFGELLHMKTLFAGTNETSQMQLIFKELGTPNEFIWPGSSSLPGMKNFSFPDAPFSQLRRTFVSELPDDDGFTLLNRLLALDPSKRFSAKEALESKWFKSDPKPAPPSSFPTWPAKSEHNKKPPNEPSAPRKVVAGFTLKFDAPKF